MADASIAPSGIVKDRWLSDILGKAAWRVDPLTPDPTWAIREGGNGFFFTRVPTRDVSRLHAFEGAGFRVIDVTVTLQAQAATLRAPAPAAARFATPADRAAVTAIAMDAFESSRLHLDPEIANSLANRSRAQWADNFFAGLRGSAMAVADHERAAGAFLLLTGPADGALTIDLVGVRRDARRRGLGAACIRFAANQIACDRLRVGTQVSNVGSIAFYESLGFRTVASHFVLHFHRT
jgi:ribosomal protein S18 acetylase RimI-like enzyme